MSTSPAARAALAPRRGARAAGECRPAVPEGPPSPKRRGRRLCGDDGAALIVQSALTLLVLALGVVFLRLGHAADLRGRTQVGVDAAALAGAGATRDHLLATLVAEGAFTRPWAAYGGEGVGCPRAEAFAAANSRSRLVLCTYDPATGLFTAQALSSDDVRGARARTDAVATLGLPRCHTVQWTDGHTRYVTTTCAGNGATAAITWKAETGLVIGPTNLAGWRALFRIRLVR